MTVFILDKAQKELDELEEAVRDQFVALFESLEINEILPSSKDKRLKGTELSELRVKHNSNIYRAIYGKLNKKDQVVVLVFQKITQKTPLRVIKTATKRLKTI